MSQAGIAGEGILETRIYLANPSVYFGQSCNVSRNGFWVPFLRSLGNSFRLCPIPLLPLRDQILAFTY